MSKPNSNSPWFLCRYVAICHPLSTHARHSKSLRAFGVLAALWLFGVCFSLPWIIPTKVREGQKRSNKFTKDQSRYLSMGKI